MPEIRKEGRGGKTVHAESAPREARDEGELVKEGRVPDPWGARTGAPRYGATILAARLPVAWDLSTGVFRHKKIIPAEWAFTTLLQSQFAKRLLTNICRQ